jgi:DNA-binding MarR family transcriptional regulator/N-acetylglutamate synthase-like GNAT family acetyltransferase
MDKQNQVIIQQIRSFNRFYTNLLGLLNAHILDSNYSLTEVRILLEIDKTVNCSANTLINKLNIDRGYMSRIIKHFEEDGLITKELSSSDNRISLLMLTQKGKAVLSVLEEKSDYQVLGLIDHLPENEQKNLIKSMNHIKNTLLDGLSPITIRSFKPEDMDYIIGSHRTLYEAEYGFNHEFGDYVEEYVHKFMNHYDEDKENLWIAEENGKPVGMIAIVKVDDSTAQLRWFLLEPEARGRGLGNRLVKTALDFCRDKNYKQVFLWTVHVLDTARHLYKSHGFTLTESIEHDDLWGGNHLTEQRYDLYL